MAALLLMWGLCLGAGPVLLEDYHLLEKLGQFNREKIPERVVHARGMGAKGFFEVRISDNAEASMIRLCCMCCT